MKKILLFLLLPISFADCYAQLPGDRSVIVTNDNTSQENHELVIEALKNQGFEIAERNDDLFSVVTEETKMEYTRGNSKTWRYLILYIYSTDKQIQIKSQYKSSGTKKKDTVYNTNRPETMKAFQVMTEVGKSLGQVSYDKR